MTSTKPGLTRQSDMSSTEPDTPFKGVPYSSLPSTPSNRKERSDIASIRTRSPPPVFCYPSYLTTPISPGQSRDSPIVLDDDQGSHNAHTTRSSRETVLDDPIDWLAKEPDRLTLLLWPMTPKLKRRIQKLSSVDKDRLIDGLWQAGHSYRRESQRVTKKYRRPSDQRPLLHRNKETPITLTSGIDDESAVPRQPANSQTTCPICMEERINSVTGCGHGFCNECIKRWTEKEKKNKSCPICREPMNGVFHIYL
ncbi:hypothetical protein ABVK25_010793 [Lepraria finkii]|uniref:RING-type domain-containing protein n=1 Tax=Lepraria finkii TaxID=1340010 RepID=A0ABR4ATZ0_9LECA